MAIVFVGRSKAKGGGVSVFEEKVLVGVGELVYSVLRGTVREWREVNG